MFCDDALALVTAVLRPASMPDPDIMCCLHSTQTVQDGTRTSVQCTHKMCFGVFDCLELPIALPVFSGEITLNTIYMDLFTWIFCFRLGCVVTYILDYIVICYIS